MFRAKCPLWPEEPQRLIKYTRLANHPSALILAFRWPKMPSNKARLASKSGPQRGQTHAKMGLGSPRPILASLVSGLFEGGLEVSELHHTPVSS